MNYLDIQNSILKIISWFEEEEIPYALIGGLAVSFRTIERATRDIDLAIAVKSNEETENLIRSLSGLGYMPETLINQTKTNRIATVRMINNITEGVYLDLLFASSGIETEIVGYATKIELSKSLTINVADIGSLLALKTLSADETRIQDKLDIKNLLEAASPKDILKAKELLNLITKRDYNRNKNLNDEFNDYLKLFSSKN